MNVLLKQLEQESAADSTSLGWHLNTLRQISEVKANTQRYIEMEVPTKIKTDMWELAKPALEQFM